MTSSEAPQGNWGEQKIALRNRRRRLLAATVLVVVIAFGFGGQYITLFGRWIAPTGEEADAGSLVWAIGLVIAMSLLISLVWQELDEIARSRCINSAAVGGISSVILLLLSQAAGKMLSIIDPLFSVMMVSLVIMLATLVYQRVRSSV